MYNKTGFMYRLSILTVLLLLSSPGLTTAQQSSCNNVMRGAIVIDYSSSYSDDFAPENLIDGDQNRSWSAAESDEAPYLVFDLGNTFEITSMQLNGYYQANDPAYQGDSVREFRLDALVNDQWETVIEGESPLADRLTDYRFPTPIVTEQVKINFISNHGGTAFEAAELVVCGQRASAASTTSGGGKQAGGKENPTNQALLLVQGDLIRDDENTWTFDANAGQIISLEIQATTQNTRFRLYNPRGEQMGNTIYAESDYIDTTYYGGMWGIDILEGGTYSISVFSGIGPYTLRVTEGYFGQVVGSVAVGQSVQGNLAQNGFDRWLIELSALQIIGIEIQTTTQNTRFRLYDPRGNQLGNTIYSESDYIDNTYFGGSVGIRILEDGLYMIAVSSGIGPYTLQVTEGYFGHTVATIAVGQSVQGRLAQNGFDRWLIALSAGQTVDIELFATTQNTRFRLFDPTGNQFESTVYADQTRNNGFTGRRQYQILTSGLYMVSVASGIGDYTITVSGR